MNSSGLARKLSKLTENFSREFGGILGNILFESRMLNDPFRGEGSLVWECLVGTPAMN